MITEDYVSFEVSKLLKEKGFEQYKCRHSYDSKGMFKWSDNLDPYEGSAPTLQMAMKWLREVHGLHIEIGNGDLDYWYVVDDVINRDENHYPITKANYEGYKTNEQAVEAALKYSLENLI